MADKKTILIIDDDPDITLAVKTMLEAADYAVETADGATSGAKKIEEVNPDLILLDIIMEDVDSGLTMAEALKGKYPVILMSTIADSSSKVFDVNNLPIKGVLQKPAKQEVLLAKVADALK